MSYTQKLASYVAKISYHDLPKSTLSAAKIRILDCLGCMLGACVLEAGKKITQLFESFKGKGEATAIGVGRKLPSPNAAYVNSYLANLLDFDDTYVAVGHPGAVVIPAALSVVQKTNASGKDLLNAIVVSYDVAIRIGSAMIPSQKQAEHVWGQSPLIFGAVAGAAKLLDLDEDKIADAFGLAGISAPLPFVRKFGLNERPVSWLKNNFGWVAMGGVLAGLLAKEGFNGNRTILDGENGFWRMAGSDQCEFERIVSGLGESFKIEQVGLKPYPACRYIHPTIDAVYDILEHREIEVSQIKRIVVQVCSRSVKDFTVYEPVDIVDGQFSIPYAVAMALLNKTPGLDWLRESNLHDPGVLEVARKVYVKADPKADTHFPNEGMFASVQVELTNGSVIQAEKGGTGSIPKGEPQNPLTREECLQKFSRLSIPLAGAKKTEQIIDVVLNIEKFAEISKLTTLLMRG